MKRHFFEINKLSEVSGKLHKKVIKKPIDSETITFFKKIDCYFQEEGRKQDTFLVLIRYLHYLELAYRKGKLKTYANFEELLNSLETQDGSKLSLENYQNFYQILENHPNTIVMEGMKDGTLLGFVSSLFVIGGSFLLFGFLSMPLLSVNTTLVLSGLTIVSCCFIGAVRGFQKGLKEENAWYKRISKAIEAQDLPSETPLLSNNDL